MKTKAQKHEMIMISFTCTKEMAEKIKSAAKQQKRSISNYIRLMLDK